MRREHPIIFQPWCVRAILKGNKTQTRRVTCATPIRDGDTLWVRESWQPAHAENEIFYSADESFRHFPDRQAWFDEDWKKPSRERRRPSIHMSRWMARLFLCVVKVRRERLGDLTEASAIAEGVGEWILSCSPHASLLARVQAGNPALYHTRLFAHAWDEIHGDGAWRAMQESAVVVLEFEDISQAGEWVCEIELPVSLSTALAMWDDLLDKHENLRLVGFRRDGKEWMRICKQES